MSVPTDNTAPLASVKNGEWITVTARHQATNENRVVAAVRPYGLTAKDTNPVSFN
jgi:hypothetical protein